MPELTFATWLGPSAVPNIFPNPSVIIGGTSLLPHFFDRVSTAEGGDLWICSPFIDDDLSGCLPSLANLHHRDIQLRVLTSDARNARNAYGALSALPWGNFEVALRRSLHAKIYLFRNARPQRICLVGSHNLTRGGSVANFEAGTLLSSVAADAVSESIMQIEGELAREFRDATFYSLPSAI